MYAGAGYSDWEIGDVDVFYHEGVYHLFHLIIPNHDYIAHAVSRDGISWKRVKNALFVGDPGEWDDDMLWTMHVSRNGDGFQMYYTGLRRSDRGASQQIGKAISDDLLNWSKVVTMEPVTPIPPHYETKDDSPRLWTSFRDPFAYVHEGSQYLLVCARNARGPVSRRGCVALLKLSGDRVDYLPPLIYPRVYDDLECPCIFKFHERYYLVGSIREDIKVRYWISDKFDGEYRSFHSDILLPQGNYAARVMWDGTQYLVYNFYFTDRQVNSLRVLPPPKQLDVDGRGRLVLKSFYRWNQMSLNQITQEDFPEVHQLLENDSAEKLITPNKWTFRSISGYEIFHFRKPTGSLIWEGTLTMEGLGKFGLVIDVDAEGNGYYFPFDLVNGFVQIRTWGFNPANNKQNFIFNNIQSNLFPVNDDLSFRFRLIRYGNYIELSIDGIVKLTLMDYTFNGDSIGIYSASSTISLSDSLIRTLHDPRSEYASQEASSVDQ
ncbi:MAG: glycosyl hydrolase family 32 [Saprospiraceae bacterium]|nr:glycosyl hydrolase family 32 [Saprospiraceae bacterium]